MATADGVAFGKSREPEHRHINARCLAGDDRRQHLAQRRAELESVAGKPRRDAQAANTVDSPKDGLPVRSDVVQTRVPAPDLRVPGSRVPASPHLADPLDKVEVHAAVWTARTRPPSTMSRCTAVFSQISAPSRRAAAANPAAVA